MENCTIYSHALDFDKIIQIVKTKLPKATIEVNQNDLQKSLTATVKGGFFSKTKTLKINYRQRKNPSYQLTKVECGLTQNLAGMVNFIQSIPAKNEAVRNKFLYLVMAANCEIAVIAEPEINDKFAAIIQKIIQDLNGFIFAQPNGFFKKSQNQHFLDKNLNLILDTQGNCEIQDIEVTVDAKYHDQPADNYTEEQLNRKAKSEAFLAEHKVKINKNLPCLPASTDVQIRSIQEIIDRAYALLIIAVKGEGIEQAHLEKVVQDKQISSFSPQEKTIYQATSLSDQERTNAVWRYESLTVILWALGVMETLTYPSEICDVPTIVGLLFKPSRTEFENAVKLRSPDEILDALDKTYRMHWATVDARIKGQPAMGNLNSSVVFERHYALNWLTNYQNQPWDEVQTNT